MLNDHFNSKFTCLFNTFVGKHTNTHTLADTADQSKQKNL